MLAQNPAGGQAPEGSTVTITVGVRRRGRAANRSPRHNSFAPLISSANLCHHGHPGLAATTSDAHRRRRAGRRSCASPSPGSTGGSASRPRADRRGAHVVDPGRGRGIERIGPVTLGELAAVEQVQPPSMTRIVARLEEWGYVTRVVDPTDRRVARVDITDSGRRLLGVQPHPQGRLPRRDACRVPRRVGAGAARACAAAARTPAGRRAGEDPATSLPGHVPVDARAELPPVLHRSAHLAGRHVDADDRGP